MSTAPTHSELMQSIGSKDGFDPMPPTQHTWFLDVGESMTSRAIAWVWAKTIRPGKGHRRSPFARDERGALTISHAAVDLGWVLPNTSAVFKRLEEQGRLRRDEKGRIWLRGDVPNPRRTKDEDSGSDQQHADSDDDALQEKEVICTEHLPRSLVTYFQRHPKNETQKWAADYQRLQEYRKKIEADAIAAARAAGQDLEERFFAAIGFEQPRTVGRPRLERREPAVQLSLLALPELYVHITPSGDADHSVQKGEMPSVQNEKGSEHKTASLLNRETENTEVSEGSPLTQTPTQTFPERETQNSPVLETVERLLGKRLAPKDPLRDHFLDLAGAVQIPERSVCRFLDDKWEEKRASNYPIRNAGALYGFATEDLPTWIRQHGRAIESARKWEASAKRERTQPADSEPLSAEEIRERLKAAAAGKGMR